jgi:uncharacterized protein (DUF885 family)
VRTAALTLILAVSPVAASSSSPPADASTALADLERAYWEWRLQEYPESATWLGDHRYGDRLTDFSAEAIERRHQETRRMREAAHALDGTTLAGQEALSLELLRWELDLAVEGQRFPTETLILDQLDGVQLAFPQLASVMPLRDAADGGAYLARLRAYPRQLEQVRALLERGIASGWTQPPGPLRSIPAQIEGQLPSDPEQSPLYAPLAHLPASLPSGERDRLSGAAREIIAREVLPALRRFRDFVRDTYLPAGRKKLAATSLPDGEAYYAHAIRAQTTTSLTPEAIHKIGLEEVARIRAAMEGVMRDTKFAGSFAEFLVFLRTDPRFYYTRPEDLLAGYRDISKRADAELPALFAELPRNTYGVRPFPDFEAPSQTTARYYPGAADGTRAGAFMVNLYRLEMRPKYEMEALSLHEAVPGHHLQIARAQELRGLPAFRRNATYTAFVEGWALYAESLGSAMGFYVDPYSRFGQLTYEMWRACRLVIDTGIHHLGWTREQAIEFMTRHTAKTETDIAVEIDRYVVWPGQALAYKIGELKIRELRARAERELGSRFDARRFHNALLDNGALPLPILEREIGRWIDAQGAAR